MRRLLCFLACPVILVVCSQEARGAAGAFSPDGKNVYLTGAKLAAGSLLRVSLQTFGTEQVKTGVLDQIVAVSSGSDGLFLATAKALYYFSLPNGPGERVCGAPAGFTMDDVAANPSDGSLLLLGRSDDGSDFPAYYLRDKKGKPQRVRCRRVGSLQGAVFDRHGDLFFHANGDLWVGKIDTSDGDEMPPAAVASRFGPCAALETQNTTSGSTGVSEIAVAGRTVYAQMNRMGGSGWGFIMSVRWSPPKVDRKDEKYPEPPLADVEQSIAAYRSALQSFRRYGENKRTSYLCGSADGRKVLFATRADSREKGTQPVKFYLGDDAGNVRPLPEINADPDGP